MTDIALWFDGRWYPAFEEAFDQYLKENWPNVEYVQWEPTLDLPTLGLGSFPPAFTNRTVKTLSQKQFLTNPAALTEVGAALNRLFKPTEWAEVGYTTTEGLNAAQEANLGQLVVVDIEVGNNIKTHLPEETPLLCVGIYDGKDCYVYTEESLQTERGRASLLRVLASRKLIAHNQKFDFRTLSAQLALPIHGHADTMLLHHALNPGAKEHGLKQLAAKYLGAPDWDSGAKQYLKNNKLGYEQIPRDVLYQYNALDVIWTWRLWNYLLEMLDGDEDRLRVALHEFRMGNFFQDIEPTGIGINVPYLTELDGLLSADMDVALERLRELTQQEKFNPNSPVQVKAALLDMGIKVKSTAEGILDDLFNDSKDADVMEFITVLLEFRGLSKQRGTYVRGFLDRRRGNLVFPTYKVHGTSTGRMSSTDPAIQTVPRDKRIRKAFVPRREGNVFMQVDFSQAELRVMACLSGDQYLISLFQPGAGDFFDSLLPVMFKGHDTDSWTAQERKDNRAKEKTVIYGLAYNRKADAIAKELGITRREAQTIISNFFKAAPEFYHWRQDVEWKALDPNSTIVSPFGRYYQAEMVNGRNKQSVINSALAFLPQSTASDICVMAAMAVSKWIGNYPNSWIVGSIHDAILLDVPDEYKEEIAMRVQNEMTKAAEAVFGTVVPFASEASWAASWGECS